MHREEDDEAWRAIVENFGERAELDDAAPDPAEGSGDEPEPEAPEDDPAPAVRPELFAPITPIAPAPPSDDAMEEVKKYFNSKMPRGV